MTAMKSSSTLAFSCRSLLASVRTTVSIFPFRRSHAVKIEGKVGNSCREGGAHGERRQGTFWPFWGFRQKAHSKPKKDTALWSPYRKKATARPEKGHSKRLRSVRFRVFPCTFFRFSEHAEISDKKMRSAFVSPSGFESLQFELSELTQAQFFICEISGKSILEKRG